MDTSPEATARQALPLWGLDDAVVSLVAARENHVYRIDFKSNRYALRLHRKGYRTDAELRSELQWMEAIGRAGLQVPAPIQSHTGAVLHRVGEVQVDVLTWMTGTPLGETGTPLETANPTDVFSKIGQALARLHTASDAWTPPPAFTRCAWDRTGLLGETPLWGRFWDNPTLSGDDRALFRQVWQVADRELAARESRLDYGLIHADLVRENILVDGDRLQLIDFDDGGYGFRLFDVATALIKNLNEPDYPALQDALIAGYLDLRPLDVEALDLFLLLRAATYVGWIMPRMDEPGADVRNTRLVDTTRHLAQRYLARV